MINAQCTYLGSLANTLAAYRGIRVMVSYVIFLVANMGFGIVGNYVHSSVLAGDVGSGSSAYYYPSETIRHNLLFTFTNEIQLAGLSSAQILEQYERLKIEYAEEFNDEDFSAKVDSLMSALQQVEDYEALVKIGVEKWLALNKMGFYSQVQLEVEELLSQSSAKISIEHREEASLLLLEAYVYLRALTKAQSLAVELIENSTKLEAIITAKYYLSNVYAYAGKYEEAVELHVDNLEYYISTNDTAAQIVTLNNVAQINQDLNQYSQAEFFYKKAEALAIESGDLDKQSLIYSNMGVYFKTVENFEQARTYYEKGLQISTQMNDLSGMAQNLFNIGNIYYEEGNYREALNYYDESGTIVDRLGVEYPKALIYMMQGTVSIDLGFYDEADAYLIQAEQIIGSNNDVESTLFLYEKLALVKQLTGDYEAAFDYLSNRTELIENKYESTSLDSLNQAIINFQLSAEKLRLENTTIEYEKLVQQRVFGIVLILLLGLGLSITLILNNRKKILIEKLFNNYQIEIEAETTKTTKEKKTSSEAKNTAQVNTLDKLFYNSRALDNKSLEHQELFDQICKAVFEEELFRDVELTLSKLAKEVNSNTTYVSEAINTNLGMRFNSFLNRIRIHEAQKIMLEEDVQIDQVLLRSGYRNRSTFYRAFQAETGLTPREFISSKQKAKYS